MKLNTGGTEDRISNILMSSFRMLSLKLLSNF